MFRALLSVGLAALLVAVLVSCIRLVEQAPAPALTSTPTSEAPAPSETPVATSTLAPSPTPSSTPTPTVTPTPTATATPTLTATPTITPTPTIATQTYRQGDGQYSLEYPATWFVGTQSGATVFSDDARVVKEGIPSGETVALVVFSQPGEAPESLDSALGFWLQMLQLGPWGELDVSPSQDDQLGGEPARGAFIAGSVGETGTATQGYVIFGHRNGVSVVMGAVAPRAQWEKHWPMLRRMIDSFRFGP